ncbi:metal-binding protein [Halobacteriales archaeon QH_10_70_21]|nr:MAG: metal-binding protein [Halobacteriales archaeon QH_10_70_21]
MKKQELIHLHGLLAEICEHYEQMAEGDVEHAKYTELGIRPTSIHKSKTDHKAAVFALADGITEEMERETETPVSAAAD